MGTVKWYGARNSSALYFEYELGKSSDRLRRQFATVLARLIELSFVRDGNGAPVVQFVAEPNTTVAIRFIAYRWTSDWARDKYDRELVHLGPSLGRGVWDPFRDPQGYAAKLMLQPPLPGLVAA
jgi:hypothetical protein